MYSDFNHFSPTSNNSILDQNSFGSLQVNVNKGDPNIINRLINSHNNESELVFPQKKEHQMTKNMHIQMLRNSPILNKPQLPKIPVESENKQKTKSTPLFKKEQQNFLEKNKKYKPHLATLKYITIMIFA